MKKFFTAVLFCLLFFSNISFAQKDTCKIGMYVLSLSDFKIDDQSFKADFWIWFIYDNDSLVMKDAIEIMNAKSTEFSNYSIEKKGGKNWAQVKCKAVINQNWDVTKFPFDKQNLFIKIEHTMLDEDEVVFVADSENSKIDSTFFLDDWDINSFQLKSIKRTYNTTFGDPVLKGSSTYPGVEAEIIITRAHSQGILVKMLTGVYVAFSIALLGFLIKPSLADRLGLCVGGIFAAVGNKYIIESVVPSSTANTLLDSIHNLTFVAILIMIALTVVSLKWSDTEDEKLKMRSQKIDRISFAVLLAGFITANIILILSARG
ncbi:MAG: hypothetical protein J0M18_05870 [Ignavibacteria bacterium]|nr:hypothetical protein [Ignavibacteria bacterium]